MALQPRKFKFKSRQKGRITKKPKTPFKLYYGHAGLVLLRSICLKSKQMSKFKMFLKRATRKVDKTQRFAWINFFPQIPLSRKPKQSRMGKGKGKLKNWFIHIRPGVTILEFRNTRRGRAIFFFKSFSTKLNSPTYFLFSSSATINSPLMGNKTTFLKSFW